MLVEIPENMDTGHYAFKMLVNNKIPGVLSCKERMEDGKSYLYVDISQKRSMLQEYKDKEMQLEDLICFFQEITAVLEEVRTYLLHENMVNLNPEYIFKDLENQKLCVLILPWISEEKTRHKLAEFFLEKVNHKDENGVNAAYHFYRQQSQTQFSLYQFLSVLEKESIMKRQKECVHSPQISYDRWEETNNYGKEMNDYNLKSYEEEGEFEKQKEKTASVKNIKKITLILAIIFLVSGIFLGISSVLKISCISFSVLMFLSYLILLLKKEKAIPKEILPMQEMEIENKETVFFNPCDDEETLKLQWKEKGRKKQYVLKEFPCTVGKIKEEVSLVISDISVSRVHCKFIEANHKICIMDLNSTNGTYLNGLPVKNGEIQEIEKNDEILIGKVRVNVV